MRTNSFKYLLVLFAIASIVVPGSTITAAPYVVKWDPEDATDEFQAAFDSKADTIIVENLGVWNVGRVSVTSNKKVILRPKVRILAKKGAFTRNYHKMFSLHGVKGVSFIGEGSGKDRPVIEMRKSEYTDDKNQNAMNVFSVWNGDNIVFRNLVLKNLGGDGITLVGNRIRGLSENILIDNLIIDGAKRNGISIVNVKGCTVQNTIIRNTEGSNPQAGIDIETHMGKEQSAIDVLIKDTVFENNKNAGIQIFMLGIEKDLGIKRLNVVIDNVTIRNTGHSAFRIARARDGVWKHGERILIKNSLIENNGRDGFSATRGNNSIFLMTKSKDLPVIVDNTVFKNSDGNPVKVWKRANHEAHTPGGIEFRNNTTIHDTKNRPWLDHTFEKGKDRAPLTDIKGTLTVVSPESRPSMSTPYGTRNVTVRVIKRTPQND